MKRSIVMIEWSRDNQPTYRNRDEFLWHQMLLSLLYDEVLAQDETLLAGSRMADWFGDSDGVRLLEQIFECGGLAVLKRPIERYPDDELKERAARFPISARREQLEKYSVDNNGNAILFKGRQLQFHDQLEALLRANPRAHRHAGARKKPGSNLMEEFAQLLIEVLTDKRYEKWLKARFKHITPSIAQDFIRFSSDPELAINHLKKNRKDQTPKLTPLAGRQDFSTALAVQLAATYPPGAAKALQSLTETVFARPFCQEEDAEGRYGRLLRDLPLASEVEETESARGINIVHIETTPLRLPVPGPKFATIINKVREKQSGQNLKRAMNDLGPEPTFASATKAWRDVADDLACEISSANMKAFNLQTVAVETSRGVFCGVLTAAAVATLIHGTGHLAPHLVEATLGGFTGPLVDALGTHFYKAVQADLQRRSITGPLENAIKFSCVRHPTIRAAS